MEKGVQIMLSFCYCKLKYAVYNWFYIFYESNKTQQVTTKMTIPPRIVVSRDLDRAANPGTGARPAKKITNRFVNSTKDTNSKIEDSKIFNFVKKHRSWNRFQKMFISFYCTQDMLCPALLGIFSMTKT